MCAMDASRPGGLAGPPRPQKERFSLWWFTLPLAMVLAAVVVFAALIALAVGVGTGVDARFPADGRPHTITVPTDANRQLAAADDDDHIVTCTVVDRRDGAEIDLEVFWGFDPDSGDLEATCTSDPPGATIEVTRTSPSPSSTGPSASPACSA